MIGPPRHRIASLTAARPAIDRPSIHEMVDDPLAGVVGSPIPAIADIADVPDIADVSPVADVAGDR